MNKKTNNSYFDEFLNSINDYYDHINSFDKYLIKLNDVSSDNYFNKIMSTSSPFNILNLDIYNININNDKLIITLSLPGCDINDINIETDNNLTYVKINKNEYYDDTEYIINFSDDSKFTIKKNTKSNGDIIKYNKLKYEYDIDSLDCKMINGMLTLKYDKVKTKEKSERKTIKIN